MHNNMWKSCATTLLSFIFLLHTAAAQELFPLSDPASSMPKHVLGIRFFSETYHEVTQWRNMSAVRLMYGLTPKLTTYLTAIASNHHGEDFPKEFPFHNTPERGAIYPYKFNGAHLYLKYRFLTLDGQNKHLRVAVYGEGAYVNTTHHESEPNLEMGDNSGIGGGAIATWLNNKLAVSLTIGYIKPFHAEGYSPDPIHSLPPVPVDVRYGEALHYAFSLGYLIYPVQYRDYRQTNINLYLECRGKYFNHAEVTLFHKQPNEYVLSTLRYPKALQTGFFADISPGIQFIVRSNLRIDFSTTFRMLGFSYARLYPVYTIGIQRYFYFGKK